MKTAIVEVLATLRPFAVQRLGELDKERTNILSAFPDLGGNGHQEAVPGMVRRKKKRRMSPEGRKRLSAAMKKRWAEKRQ